MPAPPPELRAHQEWLGWLQPVGLVVSPFALARAQVLPDLGTAAADQQALLDCVRRQRLPPAPGADPDDDADEVPVLDDFPEFTRRFLGWEAADLAGAPGGPDLPKSLDAAVPEYDDVLSPTYAVPDPDRSGAWLLLVQVLPPGADFDAPASAPADGWHASPQARVERLLRERADLLSCPLALLVSGTHLRLVTAPRGESSGHLTFPLAAMVEPAGRSIVAALRMLLHAERLFQGPPALRLPALLRESRKYQNEVSTALAEQVHEALWELVRGFQAADEARRGALLSDVLAAAPDEVYGGLLTVLLRLVFLLYAEDRGLMPAGEVYAANYAVTGLFRRLREDQARWPDAMDQRFGAWAQLLALFRLVHDGGGHGSLRLPERRGRLFDPDAFPFLEGRPRGARRVAGERLAPPRVSDGAVARVLERLLVLDGERLSYRALDVEQLGSVYEEMMGFALHAAAGVSIAVKPDHVVIDLEALLARAGSERAKALKEATACALEGAAAKALASARTVDDLLAALGKRVSPRTPRPIPRGAIYLTPTDERRRSGSHYTPRSLTEPIVATTLRPVLEALGPRPAPEQILGLKLCDPAMGSGAFLVEACRVLGEKLEAAWAAHGGMPRIPADEDPVLHARRLVAQQCLYGVDKNPFAVELAKLSLWLATLARDHPFTFLDHALRHGDSLVGLTRAQIAAFHWKAGETLPFSAGRIEARIAAAAAARRGILALADSDDTAAKERLLAEADAALADVRLVGDLVVAAWFGGDKDRERERLRVEYSAGLTAALADGAAAAGRKARAELEAAVAGLRRGPGGEKGVPVFHWEVEFPEVFARGGGEGGGAGGKGAAGGDGRGGFHAMVGNPPFAYKNTVAAANVAGYPEWLQTLHEESHGNSDLVAHFFRRAFDLLRPGGAFGLLATKTIRQGDTRATGLRWICRHGGRIYAARRRLKWPGLAAVVVSVVHVIKGDFPGRPRLDDREVERISAFLFHAGGDDDPARLAANAGKSFVGSYVLGMGFTFDDTDKNGVATPLAEMHRLIAKDKRNAERIFPYIGGEEVNTSPTHAHHRYVINFGDMSEAEARAGWPDLMRIVEERVKPQRMQDKRDVRKKYWWRFAETTPALLAAISGLPRLLINSQVSAHLQFAFVPSDMIYAHTANVFPLPAYAAFCALQSRPHEIWARFFASSLEDRLRYTPSDCFETFPFPENCENDPALEAAGKGYYEFRAALMARNDEGLTKTYNRFHDADESNAEIVRLRDLHLAMDRAVLNAYGWSDLCTTCEFLLDYDEDKPGDDDNDDRPRGRTRPGRLRWPDDVRDEVLGRLLELNGRRAASEQLGTKLATHGAR